MLVCGHDREPFGSAICVHVRTCREPWISYVRWYTGSGIDHELLCIPCANDRQNGQTIATGRLCQECFEYATSEVGELVGVRGKPEIQIDPEPFDVRLQTTGLPSGLGKIVDIAPLLNEAQSDWLLLTEDGQITHVAANTGEWKRLAKIKFSPEPNHKAWCGHLLKQRLHVSPGGVFAAIVNNYGRYGQVIDLRSGQTTLSLDGGDYHAETVPFSFAFAQVKGSVFAIHRTAWNRLDASDPSTGRLLTVRGPTSYQRGEDRPAHYLDYFHGALHISPNSINIADDGWIWHPVGVPTTWNLSRWVFENVWESEDGPSRKPICARDYYWDYALAWLDDNRIAIGGLGEDDAYMIDGARIFDISVPGSAGSGCRQDWPWPRELTAFAGPSGSFFSDGKSLFSSDETGLSRWKIRDGCRTGFLQGFNRPVITVALASWCRSSMVSSYEETSALARHDSHGLAGSLREPGGCDYDQKLVLRCGPKQVARGAWHWLTSGSRAALMVTVKGRHAAKVVLDMQSLRIVLMCVAAAVGYGIAHDQVTARVCVEYFTVGHPRVFGTDDPTLLGVGWGVVATWWVGLLLGVLFAVVAQAGSRPKRTAGSLVLPVACLLAVMAVCALAAGITGWLLARSGAVFLVGPVARTLPADRHVPFLADLWAHSGS